MGRVIHFNALDKLNELREEDAAPLLEYLDETNYRSAERAVRSFGHLLRQTRIRATVRMKLRAFDCLFREKGEFFTLDDLKAALLHQKNLDRAISSYEEKLFHRSESKYRECFSRDIPRLIRNWHETGRKKRRAIVDGPARIIRMEESG